MLEATESFYFVGYSLPDGDRHVPQMFPLEAMKQAKATITVINAANDGQSPAQAYAASQGPPPALHREARADRSPSLERLIRPRLVDPDHLLALRALEPAADHARQTDIAYDAARFELYLLDRVLDVTIAPARKLVGIRHRVSQ